MRFSCHPVYNIEFHQIKSAFGLQLYSRLWRLRISEKPIKHNIIAQCDQPKTTFVTHIHSIAKLYAFSLSNILNRKLHQYSRAIYSSHRNKFASSWSSADMGNPICEPFVWWRCTPKRETVQGNYAMQIIVQCPTQNDGMVILPFQWPANL